MKLKYIALLMLLLQALSACNDDTLFGDGPTNEAGTSLSFMIAQPTEIETRNISTDIGLSDLYLLVFDSTDKSYKGGEKIDLANITKSSTTELHYKFTPLLNIVKGNLLVLLGNTGKTKLPENITYDKINELFEPTNWNLLKESIADIDRDFPLYAKINTWSGPSGSDWFTLKRSVAKFTLSADYPTDNKPWGEVKWCVVNYAVKGALFHENDDMPINVMPTMTNEDFYTEESEGIYIRSFLENIGLPEKHVTVEYTPAFPAATRGKNKTGLTKTQFHPERQCILMWCADKQGSYTGSYYRIDLATRDANSNSYTWLDIKPNHHYKVHLKGINGKGYPTKEDALSSPSTNLVYDIEVVGGDNNVIITNGQYGLELEYDNLLAYSYLFDEFSLKCKAIIPTGSAMPTINNITLNGFTLNEPIEKITENEQVIKFRSNASTVDHNMTHRGSITLNLGTLSKTVNIAIKTTNLDAHAETLIYSGDRINNIFDNFREVYWEQIDPGLSCHANSDGTLTVTCEENVTPTAWFNHNTGTTSNADVKEAEPLFTTKALMGYGKTRDSHARTKVIITQNPPAYIGWVGGSNSEGTKRFVLENHEGVGQVVMPQYAWAASDWGSKQYIDSEFNDLTLGQKNTAYLMGWPNEYPAAKTCWLKNDKNGNGVIEDWEIKDNPWYMPSYHQMIQIWATVPSLLYPFRNGYFYMSSTEYRETISNDKIYNFHLTTMSTGNMYYGKKGGVEYNVRCVKNI